MMDQSKWLLLGKGKKNDARRNKNRHENRRLSYPAFLMAGPGLVCPVSDPGGWSAVFENKEPSREPPVILCPVPVTAAQD